MLLLKKSRLHDVIIKLKQNSKGNQDVEFIFLFMFYTNNTHIFLNYFFLNQPNAATTKNKTLQE